MTAAHKKDAAACLSLGRPVASHATWAIMPVARLYHKHIAYRPLVDEFLGHTHRRIPVQNKGNERAHPGLVHGSLHGAQIRQVHGHRLLDQDMFARLGGLNGLGSVQVIGRAQDDDVYLVSGK